MLNTRALPLMLLMPGRSILSPVVKSVMVSMVVGEDSVRGKPGPKSNLKKSLPAPPVSTSASRPPISRSLPAPPMRVSLLTPPMSVSLAEPPVKASLPSPPVAVKATVAALALSTRLSICP